MHANPPRTDPRASARREIATWARSHVHHLALAAIVLGGTLLRIGWMVHQAAVIPSDGAEYARMAEHLLHDHALVGNFEGPEIMYAPLYPTLIAGFMLAVRSSEIAAHLVSLLSGVAVMLLVFLIADYVYGRRTAYVCATVATVHPLLVALSGSVYNESLYLPVLLAVVYTGLRAVTLQRLRDSLLLGISLGLAYLTRVEAFAYVVFFVGALLVAGVLRKRTRAAWAGSAIMLAAFAVLASPYVAFLSSQTGKLRLQAKFDMNYTVAREHLAGISDDQAQYGIASDGSLLGPMLAPSRFSDGTPYPHSLKDELATLARTAEFHRRDLYHYFTMPAIGAPFLLGLVVLGLFGHPWSKRRIELEILLGVMTGSIVFVVATSATGEFRYFLPIVPLLLLWAGKGLDELGQWIMRSAVFRGSGMLQRGAGAGVLELSVLLVMIAFSARGVGRNVLFRCEHSSAAREERQAALWLEHYDPQPKRIAVRYAVLPYYAKGTLIDLPYGSSAATLRYLNRRKVDFVVLESGYQKLPALGAWLAHGIPDGRARLIYDQVDASGERVRIYRWRHA